MEVYVCNIVIRRVTSTNKGGGGGGQLLGDKNSTRHQALAKFSKNLDKKQNPILWLL